MVLTSLLDNVKGVISPHLHTVLENLLVNEAGYEYQLLLDLALLAVIIYILLKHQIIPEKPLTLKEQQEVLDDWEPEPLKPVITPLMRLNDKVPTITKTTTTHVTINNKEILNLVRANWLGFIGNKRVEDSTIKTLEKYGTGTCGPRGFYGTIDVHLNLEQRIRDFMGAEDAVIYSFGFATVSSVIPAFAARGDLLIVDDGVNYAVQTGVKLSRSEVIYFKHNDMADLERVLKQVQQKDRGSKKKLNRRYIVVEGLFFNFGDIVNLPKVMELKEKYKYRLMLDDSYGIGVLGKTGRGVCEYFNVNVRDVEFITGSLEPITSSVGGFCCGESSIIYHQRLNSNGYVYSCSLPPLLASASITAFDIIDEQPQLLTQLRKNTDTAYKGLSKLTAVNITSQPASPVIHLRLANPPKDRLAEETILQNIVDEALAGGVFLTRARYVYSNETFLPSASIRVAISAAFTEQQLQAAIAAIKTAVDKVMTGYANNQHSSSSTSAPAVATSAAASSSSPSSPAQEQKVDNKKKNKKAAKK
jgi:serine palmitoyltransferase